CFNPQQQGAQVDKRCKSSTTLVLPLDRPIRLHLTSRDVIHSFWVPEFRQKQDAVPGLETEITVTPTRTGNFPFICTELCGAGHALMRSRAIVMPQGDFAAWLRRGVREMTTTVDEHAEHEAYVVSPPPSGWRRYLLGPGWIRAIWMTALFFGLGLGLVV